MTIALLIRHGETDAIAHRLAGRLPGIHLNARGRDQARRLARLAHLAPLDAIYSSPLERARETAAALARASALDLQIEHDINEVDFGAWAGLTFDALNARADWQQFNSARSTAMVPRGESAPDVQRRIVTALDRLAGRHRGGMFAAISHAEVIRAAVLHVLGMTLDDVHRITIDPGSVTAIDLDASGRLVYVNREVDALTPLAASPPQVFE